MSRTNHHSSPSPASSNDSLELENYRWLIGDEAAKWLEKLTAQVGHANDPTRELDSLSTTLRKDLSATRVRLIVEQVALRRRAMKKFSRAHEMLYTRRALEQATDEALAHYKAQRYTGGQLITDICCGIGGDLLSLAQRTEVKGVDNDPVMALLCSANASSLGVNAKLHCATLSDVSHTITGPWHLDPDRRPGGGRTIRVEDHQPGKVEIETLLATAPNGAVKLAPAATPPDSWQASAELEWISRNGECKQLVAWFGELCRGEARRVATIIRAKVGEQSLAVRSVIGDAGDEDLVQSTATEIGQYLFDPDAAVLAAGLNARLAAELELEAVSHESVYLTGNSAIHDAAVAGFEVIDVLPFRKKPLKQFLRARGMGQVEIKKRGVRLDANQLQRELSVGGEGSCTVLITPVGKRIIAIVANRFESHTADKPPA